MNIEMNLVSDWQDIIIEDMVADGLRFSKSTQKDLLVIRYFTYLRKKGGVTRKRRLHLAKEFNCPLHLKNGFDKLIDVLENGQDISPYLSKMVDKISFFDGMFNDWGVLHLHLGDHPDEKDGNYVARTGPVLFLYLNENEAYLINVYEHGSWTDKSVLQTVYDNWPELIEPYIFKGVKELQYQITEENHEKLRKKGYTVMLELKDISGNAIILAPPGLGITASRDAMHDVRSYKRTVNDIRRLEQDIRENPQLIQTLFKDSMADALQLRLVLENNNLYVIEQTTQMKVDQYIIRSV
ncbi:hypothetical protein [Paenibacillus sp. PDC88]|uniref:Replication-relaxation n=2 Tax=Bacillati TaxID=1783272 RepID=A0ABW3Q233_9BACL|nr:hypothetical protein [Paenibacillus sp. PDC88]SDX63531.1 hypothetical protein SAMN05518848_110102 [Paenibacillus sp. PDC88]